jgi:hypothetical protein
MKYCLDCEWSVSDHGDHGNQSDADSSRRAIAHAVETGHSISSDDSPSLPPLRAEIGPALTAVFRSLTRGEGQFRDL